jgi:low temperature requirement protein LtrA
MLPGTARNALWVAAVVVDYVGPAAGFFTPGLGRSTTADWTIAGGHLAERCQQFLIIALGESVLDTGVALSGGAITPGMVGAVVVAFAGNVALWWIYFDRGAGDSSAIILRASDPGRLGRSAYTYFHLPMVAGVIVTAVADEWTVAHPTQVSGAAALTILGGPVLFLVGHFLFKRAIFGKVAVSRLVAIVALAVLMPIGLIATPLALALAATLILAAVAWWDTRHHVADAR